ncbi:MAG: CBS domain-containing protein [Desulfohalobiaceae bacterium]
MTTVSEIMTRDVITVRPDTPVAEAAKLLLDKRVNGLPVVDEDNTLVGIICQSDLITQQKKLPLPTYFTLLDGLIPLTSLGSVERQINKMSATEVKDAMTVDPVSVSPDSDVQEVANLMVEKNFHTIPVVKEGKLAGIVGKEDILRMLAG